MFALVASVVGFIDSRLPERLVADGYCVARAGSLVLPVTAVENVVGATVRAVRGDVCEVVRL